MVAPPNLIWREITKMDSSIDESKVIINERFIAKFASVCVLEPSLLARKLLISDPSWQRINIDYKGDSYEQKFQALKTWLNNNPRATLKKLRELTDSGLNDVIKDTELIHECLESGKESDPTDFIDIVMNETSKKLHDYYGYKRKSEVEIKEEEASSIKKIIQEKSQQREQQHC